MKEAPFCFELRPNHSPSASVLGTQKSLRSHLESIEVAVLREKRKGGQTLSLRVAALPCVYLRRDRPLSQSGRRGFGIGGGTDF